VIGIIRSRTAVAAVGIAQCSRISNMNTSGALFGGVHRRGAWLAACHQLFGNLSVYTIIGDRCDCRSNPGLIPNMVR